ncbi:EAL domain-containing protein [Achromobacter sp. UMC46]|uniref:EAL domain-containing protein n=1 Tax=Achromobacter sp. UMC46 TaxID=1862319 RepID=UPI0016011280|nr:EAL domain-containing protein [Achromobacter sp. UMC46]MBB1597496.1 hypothetical protein [Achromobacter sp. UMC46]
MQDTQPGLHRVAKLLQAGSLQMHYQPIFDFKTGNVTQVEALARLIEGTRVLPPSDFLPYFGREELFELFARGLELAVSQRDVWLHNGIPLRLSVNMPSFAFCDDRYYAVTRDTLSRHRCPPRALTLEVLEHWDVCAEITISNNLRKFKELGVLLAEDDLGAGHSGLQRLRELPFDSFKIDRSIICMADSDHANALHFVHQLTRLGHLLGKTVVVEGVESSDLIEAIRILGADAVQGYAIARPMPAEQLTAWIRGGYTNPASRPQTILTKLARLLILEERLSLMSEPHAGKPSAGGGAQSFAAIFSSRTQCQKGPSCLEDHLASFRAGINAIFSENHAYVREIDVLVSAISRHGLMSNHYRQARKDLTAAAMLIEH